MLARRVLLGSGDDVLEASVSHQFIECGCVIAERLVQSLPLYRQVSLELCLHLALLGRVQRVQQRADEDAHAVRTTLVPTLPHGTGCLVAVIIPSEQKRNCNRLHENPS